jgi:hypothetical protein
MYRKLPNCLTPCTIIIVWNKILQKQKINNTYTTENQRLPCVSIFAMRFISRAEQRACLSCVFYMAHDKGLVCRASGKNARQTHDFVVRFFRICTANYFSLPSPHTEQMEYHYFKKTLSCSFFLTHDKLTSLLRLRKKCRALGRKRTTKYFFIFSLSPKFIAPKQILLALKFFLLYTFNM